jgi:hypothetical protein
MLMSVCTLTRRVTCRSKSRGDLSRFAPADTSAGAGEAIFRQSPVVGEGESEGSGTLQA